MPDDTAQLWDMATRQPIGLPLINGQGGAINSVAFSPDGKTLAAGDADDTVRLWNMATRLQICSPLTGHGGSVTSVAFSPDGKTLASGSYDLTVRLWNVAKPTQNLADATNLMRYCAPWQDGPSPRPMGTIRAEPGIPNGLPLNSKPAEPTGRPSLDDHLRPSRTVMPVRDSVEIVISGSRSPTITAAR